MLYCLMTLGGSPSAGVAGLLKLHPCSTTLDTQGLSVHSSHLIAVLLLLRSYVHSTGRSGRFTPSLKLLSMAVP